MSDESIEERIIELETRWAHQEDALQKLSDALIAQQGRIDRLEALLDHWVATLTQPDDAAPFDPANENPPHY